MVVTSRRIDQLQQQCRDLGVAFDSSDGRESLMDKLREAIGSFDPDVELDPMKCYDLKKEISWGSEDPFKAITSKYLNADFVAEPKLDGARMRLFLGLKGSTMNSGRRSVKTFAYTDRTQNFPHLAQIAIPELMGTVLDGELLAPTGKIQTHTGTWTNSLLNASVALVNSNPVGSRQTQERFGKAQFWVFDVMQFKGEDITHLPYFQRRTVLEKLVKLIQSKYPDCEMRIVPQFEATADVIVKSIEEGFEGVVLKKKTGPYQFGKRSKNWLKIKTFSTADAFIVGWAAGENTNTGLVGSLDLAVLEEVTQEEWNSLPSNRRAANFDSTPSVFYKVRPVAQVGNLIHDWRKHITADNGSLKSEFYGAVIEFAAQGLGKNGRARHAHMLRLRPDKSMLDCMSDQLDIFPAV